MVLLNTEFTHLLLTRFNTAMDFDPSAKRLEKGWLTGRLELFERYCLPSVAAQTGVEFHWLVFFDAASPQWFKDKISKYRPSIKPIYIDGPATDEVIQRLVVDSGLVSTPYLVSTRLDNDDAISRDHLSSVQSVFQSQERQFIAFPLGLQSFHGHLYTAYWPSNPFLSLIEKVGSTGEVTTVFCVRHDLVGKTNQVKKIFGAPQWLQVIHGSNHSNSLRGWPRLRNREHAGFDVAWPEPDPPDSLAQRFGIFAGAYWKGAEKLVTKAAGAFSK